MKFSYHIGFLIRIVGSVSSIFHRGRAYEDKGFIEDQGIPIPHCSYSDARRNHSFSYPEDGRA
jgi:hypothetical protein